MIGLGRREQPGVTLGKASAVTGDRAKCRTCLKKMAAVLLVPEELQALQAPQSWPMVLLALVVGSGCDFGSRYIFNFNFLI